MADTEQLPKNYTDFKKATYAKIPRSWRGKNEYKSYWHTFWLKACATAGKRLMDIWLPDPVHETDDSAREIAGTAVHAAARPVGDPGDGDNPDDDPTEERDEDGKPRMTRYFDEFAVAAKDAVCQSFRRLMSNPKVFAAIMDTESDIFVQFVRIVGIELRQIQMVVSSTYVTGDSKNMHTVTLQRAKEEWIEMVELWLETGKTYDPTLHEKSNTGPIRRDRRRMVRNLEFF